MPQSDFIVENSTYPQFRAELNAALLAGVTNSSGTSAPNPSYPGQIWVDLQSNTWKVRNISNTAWNIAGRLGADFWGITAADLSALTIANNLNDVANKASARLNLGITRPAANRLINAQFRINQRGLSSYPFAASSFYTLDHWFYYSASTGGTVATGAITQEAFTVGQTVVPGEPQNFLRLTNTSQGTSLAADSLHVISQPIEDVRTFAGQQCILSFWARSTIPNKSIGVELNQNFGSGGSAAVTSGGLVLTVGTTWQQFNVLFTIPSITGKTLGTGHCLYLVFWLQAGSSNASRAGGTFGWQGTGQIEFANVQLEPGSVATPFEQVPLWWDLRACQRYYEEMTFSFAGYNTTGGFSQVPMKFAAIKRVTPTIVVSNPAQTNCTSATYNIYTDNISVATQVAATGTFVYAGTFKANAEL